MILTIARVMLLSLIRDRGALIMVFLLPPAIFVVFAAIFSKTGEGNPDLRIGLLVAAPDPAFEKALTSAPSQSVQSYDDEAALRLDIAEGRLDGGIVLRAPLTDMKTPPLLVLVDPGKQMAGAVLDGRVRALLTEVFPQVMIARQAAGLEAITGPFTPDQAARLEGALAGASEGGGGAVTEVEQVGDPDKADPNVSYYAGAIAIMFLLFSATSTAAGLIDERRSGILDRFAAGPGGIDVVVLGKTVFLIAQGFAQATLVFTVAAVFYKVPVGAHLPQWGLTTLVVATAAAGVGLFSAAACTTRAQAQTVSNFVVLVLSALGGSMVPRFLMPDWLRDIGAFTPNAWAIDAYQGILTRDLSLAELATPLGALAALGIAGTLGALFFSRRRMQL